MKGLYGSLIQSVLMSNYKQHVFVLKSACMFSFSAVFLFWRVMTNVDVVKIYSHDYHTLTVTLSLNLERLLAHARNASNPPGGCVPKKQGGVR